MNESQNRILFFMIAPIIAKTIYSAIELGISDLLSDGPKETSELAGLAKCSPSHLQRLLLSLSNLGIFAYSEGKFRNTPLSEALRRDSDDSAWPIVSFCGREMYKAMDNLPMAIRSGNECWDKTFGSSVWDYFDEHPERGSVFDKVMTLTSTKEATAICQAYDFSQTDVIVDVGGGSGAFLAMILEHNENAEGVVFDMNKVVERARKEQQRRPAYSRCRFVGGNFFAEVPADGDVYVLKRILHDWDDNDSVRILRACHAAMRQGSRLLIVERSTNEDQSPRRPTANWMDVGMMVFGGRERSVAEYERLLDSARFAVTRVVPTPSWMTLIEATRT